MNSFVFSSLIVWSASIGHQRFNFVNSILKYFVDLSIHHLIDERMIQILWVEELLWHGQGIVHSADSACPRWNVSRTSLNIALVSREGWVFTTATLLSHDLGLASVVQFCDLSYKVQCVDLSIHHLTSERMLQIPYSEELLRHGRGEVKAESPADPIEQIAQQLNSTLILLLVCRA